MLSVYEKPFVPTTRSDTFSAAPAVCRHMLRTRAPFAYSYSTAKWSKMLPYCGSTRAARPPMPMALTGWPPMAQFMTSRLCTCCSTMWSPEHQPVNSQLRTCHSMSDQLFAVLFFQFSAARSTHSAPMFQ